MRLSTRGLSLLKQWEGSSPRLYRDSAGLLTIGVGHLLTRAEISSGKILINGSAVDVRNIGLTDAQTLKLLEQDIRPAEAAVNEGVALPRSLEQHQFDALVSFTFNVGVAAFLGSTLLKLLNKEQYDDVPVQLARWNKAGGRVVPGLVNRRTNEIMLWRNRL